MTEKLLYTIRESYEYLERQVSVDSLYEIAKQDLVRVVRCGRGPFRYPRSSLDLIASGQVDLSSVVSRRQKQRGSKSIYRPKAST